MALTRRTLLLSSASIATAGPFAARAASLIPTPAQTRGPFYPRELPAEADADLTRVEGQQAPAQGKILDLSGRVLETSGRSIRGARVEIWQCDHRGRYHHPWDERDAAPDPGFQGYGQTLTGAEGQYRFRTIKPVPYWGRAPHIHFVVTAPGAPPLVTQMYVAGEPANAGDGVLGRIEGAEARASVLVELAPHAEEADALRGTFDVVLRA